MAALTARRPRRPARRGGFSKEGASLGWAITAWIVGLIAFFPVLYMFLTGFKSESAAVDLPPKLVFVPTFENYEAVFDINFLPFFRNSILTSLVSTFFVMLLGIPCAYALALRRPDKWKDVLFFFISTRFLPPAGVIVPLYILFSDQGDPRGRELIPSFSEMSVGWWIALAAILGLILFALFRLLRTVQRVAVAVAVLAVLAVLYRATGQTFPFGSGLGLLGTRTGLIVLYTAMNLPIAVWMLRSFFEEVPRDVLDAARVDGAGLFREMTQIVLPMVTPGLVATVFISIIFAWNEFFFAFNLAPKESTVPMFMVRFVTSEGLFWAKLAASSTMAVLPIVLLGWIAQRQLVRGLSLGAVK
jgi:ABC-type glycerol-3-phosphate transport system permease component